MRLSLTTLATLLLSAPGLFAGEAEARYQVSFDATWSSTTHPGAYPNNAHFSPLIGATHSGQVSFWAPGAIASSGIESMAETGATGALASEVNQAILQGSAGQVINGGGADAPGSATATLTATDEHSLVSLVTMIAPSPDWFVGVHDLDLFAGDQWADEIVVQLFAYDSGTDNGTNFTSSNSNTNPAQPITLLTSGPFFGNDSLGTFTFTRLSSTHVYGCASPAGSLSVSSLFLPVLGSSVDISLDDPSGQSNPSATFLMFSFDSAPGFPCGISIPGLGLGTQSSAPGELLLPGALLIQTGPIWSGAPVNYPIVLPSGPAFANTALYAQGILYDGTHAGLTEGVELFIGG